MERVDMLQDAPYSEDEYQELVAVLDQLIDIVGEDEAHPLASLMEVIGVLIGVKMSTSLDHGSVDFSEDTLPPSSQFGCLKAPMS
jgi:HTH-type transcriptional regulator/antitoxin HigA